MSKMTEKHACDFCGTEPKDFIIDGRTLIDSMGHGSWAWMCQDCWAAYGVGRLGTGCGQKFDQRTLEKVEG